MNTSQLLEQEESEANVGEKDNLAVFEKPHYCRAWAAPILGVVNDLAPAAWQSRARAILLVTHCCCFPSHCCLSKAALGMATAAGRKTSPWLNSTHSKLFIDLLMTPN